MLRLCTIVVTFAACGPDTSFEDRFLWCRDLMKDKAALKEAAVKHQAADCFTPGSRVVLERLWAQAGDFEYGARLDRLLDYDTVTGPPEIEHKVALLPVKKGRTVHRLLMVFEPEDSQWRFDLLELPRFWDPLEELGKG